MLPRTKPRPHCHKCGLFLIGGKNGYCPSTHMEFRDKEKLADQCFELLLDYPMGIEKEKIRKQIEKLRG